MIQLVEREAEKRELTGSEILLRSLIREKVEVIFGYPGGAVLPIYDHLYKGKIRHLLARHEQGAIHAADGYARATGKPGVVLATSGPGATNLVTGIATAMLDSVPLVCITGNVAQNLLGTDAFQEADITGITMPITKHNYLVRDVKELPSIVKEAFIIATTGRPGPVLIDIPKDVSNAKAVFSYPVELEIPGYKLPGKPDPAQLEKLYAAISEAKKPVILAGGGVVSSGAADELREFAEKSGIPVATTLMGLGGFSGNHPYWLGMPGMHGTYAANHALLECDLLIGIGVRFDDRVTMGRIDEFATRARIVHIDIDPAEIGKNVSTWTSIVGDVKTVLQAVNQNVLQSDSQAWFEKLQTWRKDHPLVYQDNSPYLKPQWVIEEIYRSTWGEAIISTDVGQHQMWVAQYYRFHHPRSLLTSGGLGTMGFGFPAAIGAKLGVPDRPVIAVTGDGGFQMTSQELALLTLENIPVKVAIINNRYLGMVRQWQEVFYEKRYCDVDLTGGPDFLKLSEAYGIRAWRAKTKEEASQAWKEAMEHPGPAVVDFWVDPEENVYPFVAPGSRLDEMVMGDE
ncbi:biosynthetic-type acetolactate synthase large subunit [Thermoactinomyces mirandus]|uniref:Acetolactate synthase n=1 Tax=Thermoactinomyces mirandus TaxID=2756294 RepID=A0A7W2AQ63_9BACL|nr:biosynthetic-type acetolactate synthase large subunit [Thermoactinomyces mirandus]MBA4601654.1 biosynthetic-type acetolactate synthase large subunit [Thermoactinomyces mirandus]